VLNSFENRTRKLSPPIETRTICRNVLLFNPGSGGIFFGSTSWGAVLHVPTHNFVESEFEYPKRLNEIKNTQNVNILKKE
jgi:hypothetical protein